MNVKMSSFCPDIYHFRECASFFAFMSYMKKHKCFKCVAQERTIDDLLNINPIKVNRDSPSFRSSHNHGTSSIDLISVKYSWQNVLLIKIFYRSARNYIRNKANWKGYSLGIKSLHREFCYLTQIRSQSIQSLQQYMSN